MDFKELPDMSSAYQEILEKSKKKEPRWQDDDCDGKWYEKSDVDGKISKREKKAKEKAYSEEVEDVEEAVYGGAKKEKKDTRMVVTAADKKANTKAYQNYKAGHKAYKAADHLKNEEKSEELRATGVFTEEEIAKIVEADCLGKIEESEKLAQKAYKRAQELGAKRRSSKNPRGIGKSERAGYNLAQSQRSRNVSGETQGGSQTGGGPKSFGYAKHKSNPVKSKSVGDTGASGHYKKRDEKITKGKKGQDLKSPRYKLSAKERLAHHSTQRQALKDPKNNPKHTAHKKEAFYFTDEELESLNELYAFTDEQLVCFFEEIIYEIAEDEDDLLEICEALEEVELLDEATSRHSAMPNVAVQKPKNVDLGKDKGAEARERLKSKKTSSDSKPEPKRSDRLRAGLKKAGSAIKKGLKAAGKKIVGTAGKAAGHAAGEYQAARIKAKRAAMSRPTKQNTDKKDDDGTGGKLDKLLSDVKGKRSDSSSSTTKKVVKKKVVKRSSSSGETRKAVGGALKAVGRLVKKGVKKAVGKTARFVSKGSDKLASRLGEDYDKIAHLYESGLFPIEEIETIIEEMHNVNV